MTKPMGRPSIFRDKRGGMRVQAIITKIGKQKFLAARSRLAEMAKRKVSQVSDADVVEALSRGWEETEAYLKGE